MAEPLPTDARSLLDAWTSYETLLLVFTFMAVFQHLTPASSYLQTQDLDINRAFNITRNAKKKVEQLHDSFAGIVSKVNKFINTINENDLFEEIGSYIEAEFLPTRQKKVKKMPGEECINESSTSSQQASIQSICQRAPLRRVPGGLSYPQSDTEHPYQFESCAPTSSFFYFQNNPGQFRGLVIDGLLHMLEQNDNNGSTAEVQIAIISITNACDPVTDEDLGDEDYINVNNLPTSQLQA
ncbi:hypothetical protein ILUMI_00904 [Ignelater luminosus]|uniref:Uncharacterized protein n=1 Tax=Ignelater luminosus TaxID=2038154 RepID=A0A8K0DL19_IGNLU|nr:hypothetical protein ILUMI_00904 [Ignelater luminosus]